MQNQLDAIHLLPCRKLKFLNRLQILHAITFYGLSFFLFFPLSEPRDRGSVTSLSSDFSLITEDTSAPSSLQAEATDPITTGPQASNG